MIFGFPLGPGWSVCKLGRSASPRTSYVGLGCVKIRYHGCISGTGALYTVHFYFPIWNIFLLMLWFLAQVYAIKLLLTGLLRAMHLAWWKKITVRNNYLGTQIFRGLIWIKVPKEALAIIYEPIGMLWDACSFLINFIKCRVNSKHNSSFLF